MFRIYVVFQFIGIDTIFDPHNCPFTLIIISI
jgi:hypothetical protein